MIERTEEADREENDGWWWIDYLENELDPALERELEMLLQHSAEDRDLFENFRLLKEWLGDSDPVGEWPVEERLARARGRVMSHIEGDATYSLKPETNSLSV